MILLQFSLWRWPSQRPLKSDLKGLFSTLCLCKVPHEQNVTFSGVCHHLLKAKLNGSDKILVLNRTFCHRTSGTILGGLCANSVFSWNKIIYIFFITVPYPKIHLETQTEEIRPQVFVFSQMKCVAFIVGMALLSHTQTTVNLLPNECYYGNVSQRLIWIFVACLERSLPAPK